MKRREGRREAVREFIAERFESMMSIECECGGRKRSYGASGCDRCRLLDGGGVVQSEVIMALRLNGRMTAAQLNAELSGFDPRQVYNALRTLRGLGRVRVVGESEGSGVPAQLWDLVVAREVAA